MIATRSYRAGRRESVKNERGVALILALLVLAFLSILGGAFLTASTIDVWISDNYKISTQTLYLAEAGIDSGRQLLLTSGRTPSELLALAAGPDNQLSSAADLAGLLASDDVPLIPSDPAMRSTGQPLLDDSGEIAGYYYVWLRNDNADGATSLADSNQTVTLLSFGSNRGARKTIEAVVQKGAFPDSAADPRLQTSSGLQDLAARIEKNATDVYSSAVIGSYGSPATYRVAAVAGNVDLGPGTGYGILLARGNVNVTGDFVWNGLILVVGGGSVQWNGHTGVINGGMLVFGTYNVTDAAQIRLANQSFPYRTVAIQEK
jgi:PilX N-terminal